MLEDRECRRTEPAADGAIEALERIAPIELPEELLQLLRYSNGGEGPIPVQPWWFVLDSAEQIAATARLGTLTEFFPSLFVFGGNGGGEAFALDWRDPEISPVVCFDMTNIDLEESIMLVAPDFSAFVTLLGRDEAAS